MIWQAPPADIAGEMAAERSAGSGSLQVQFLDMLYGIRDAGYRTAPEAANCLR